MVRFTRLASERLILISHKLMAKWRTLMVEITPILLCQGL